MTITRRWLAKNGSNVTKTWRDVFEFSLTRWDGTKMIISLTFTMHVISAYFAWNLPLPILVLGTPTTRLPLCRAPDSTRQHTCGWSLATHLWRTMAAMPINRLGGRKRRDDLWTYFQYNSSERKTECIVLGDDGKCGHKLGGKNTTNLKRHLKAHHADIFSKVS